MRLTWGDLQAHNFRAWANGRHSLAGPGLYFYYGRNQDLPGSGSNGAGKSTVPEAFAWCVYGELPRNDNLPRDKQEKAADLIGPADKFAAVTVDGVVHRSGGQQTFQIVRTQKRSSSALELYVDGEPQHTGATNADTQARIDALLGLDFAGFKAVCFFAGSFRFAEMKDSEVKALFEQLLGIDGLDAAGKLARQDVEAAKRDQERLSAELARCSSVVEERTKAHDAMRQHWSEELKSLEAAVAEAVAEVETTDQREHLTSLREEVAAAEAREAALRADLGAPPADPGPPPQLISAGGALDIGEPPAEHAATIAAVAALFPQLDAVEAQLRAARESAEKRRAEGSARLVALTERLATLMQLHEEGRCSTCEQAVDQAHADDVVAPLVRERDALEAATQAAFEERAKLDAGLTSVKTKREEAQRVSFEAKSALREWERKAEQDARERSLQEQNAKRAAYDLQAAAFAEYQRMSAAADHARQRAVELLRNLERERDRLRQAAQIAADRAQARFTEANKRAQERQAAAHAALEEARAELATTTAAAETGAAALLHLQAAADVFGLTGLRGAILDEVMPSLNENLRRILGRVTDGALTVSIEATGRRKKDDAPDGKVTIAVSVLGGGSKYGSCSKGERARVNLPIVLALRRTAIERRGVDPGILWMDEVLDDMDEVGVERTLPVLHGEAEASRVNVVTHYTNVPAQGVPVLVSKSGGVTTVVAG